MLTCDQITRASSGRIPDAAEAGRLDAGICATLAMIFIILLLRYAYWAYGAERQRDSFGRPQKLWHGLVNATSASLAFFIAIALPSHWVRNAMLTRAFAAIRNAADECNKPELIAKCATQCAQVKLKYSTAPQLASDIVVRATSFTLAAFFLFLTCFITIHARNRAISSMNTHDVELGRSEDARKQRSNRYVLKILEPDDIEQSEDEHCVVCLGELNEMRACELECEHKFHKRCIEKWLRKANKPSCPLCQSPVSRIQDENDS